MIVQKDFLNKLRDFGLNSYESKLWTALLSRGVSTAGELSDIADVPRSRSYDVLESLEKKGFVIMKLGKPIKYIAVPPTEVIDRVKNKIQEKAESQIRMISDLKSGNVLNELNLLHTQGIESVEPFDLSGSIKDRTNIYNHLATMIKKAKKSVSIVTSNEGVARKVDALKSVLEKAKQRGVKVKIMVPNAKEAAKTIKDISKIAEIKDTGIKARFCIVDGKELMFMLLDDNKVHSSYDTAIWVNTDFFASALENTFNSEWKKAQ